LEKLDPHRALREIELLNPFSMKASQEIAALAHIIAGETLWRHAPEAMSRIVRIFDHATA
jgi:hypothetical protein